MARQEEQGPPETVQIEGSMVSHVFVQALSKSYRCRYTGMLYMCELLKHAVDTHANLSTNSMGNGQI
jgi:hypothetical protein